MNNQKDKTNNTNKTALWILLIGVPVIVAIIYFKVQTDESTAEMKMDNEMYKSEVPVAVPDTSIAADAMPMVKDTVMVAADESVGTDTRSAMEAGDEDGYWDGWYDGAETGERTRYDENSNFKSEHDRKVYAESYREGYAKGFEEAMEKRHQ